jgi:hypothetical protein
LLLDLGASPNKHAWGIMQKVPYKLREAFLAKLVEAKTNNLVSEL